MTTAMTEPPKAAKPEVKKPQLAKVLFQGAIQLEKIAVVSNVRKKFDEHAIKELAANIASIGVTTPILLRPGKAEGTYELVAGERRYRAAKSIGLKEIPAIVKDLDNDAALEHQAAENIHRKDLTPIEEARTFKALLDAKRYTVADISDLIGKNKVYVYRSISILELPKEILEAIEAGELTPAHGRQILRVPPADRKGLFNMAKQNTAKELQEQIDRDQGENLSKARFDVKKPYAGEIACTACPYNSGNQDQLFDGAEKGKCLNTKCFEKKTTLAGQEQLETLRKKYPAAKFVQAVNGWIYANHTEDKGFVVRGEFDKPTKGEFALFLSTMDGKLHLATPAAKEKDVQSQRAAAQAQQKADPKATFVQKAIGSALLKALAEKSTKLTKNHLVAVLENLLDGGPQSEPIEEVLGAIIEPGKMNEAELCQAITLLTVAPYGSESASVSDLEHFGVKVKQIQKNAAEVAEKGWIAHKASQGMEWPKNIAEVDKVLAHVIKADDKKWTKYKKTGLTDGELENLVRGEFPDNGGGSEPRWWNAKRVGLLLWLSINAGKDKDAALCGVETRNRARIILGIPYAKETR